MKIEHLVYCTNLLNFRPRTPYLDDYKAMVPFGYQSENPFELTRRTEKQTWNHQLNLCYMYDFQVDPCPQCSTPVDPYEVTTDPFVVSTKFETHIKNVTQEICDDNLGKKRRNFFSFESIRRAKNCV